MALVLTSLNSGSNGNCYYIGNDTDAVLIDAGISCRETEKRLRRLSLSIDKVRAIFISHEHTDHIYGLPTLLKRYRIPVYITNRTAKSGRLDLDDSKVYSFQPHLPVKIGGLTVTPFPKY